MADFGELGKGFFGQLNAMRDYNLQQAQVKFNAQLKLKEMALQEREQILTEEMLNAKIEGAKQELRLGELTNRAYEEYFAAQGPVKTEGRKGPDVTREVNENTFRKNKALLNIVALKDPNALYLSPEEKLKAERDTRAFQKDMRIADLTETRLNKEIKKIDSGGSVTSTGSERERARWLDLGEKEKRSKHEEREYQSLDKKYGPKDKGKVATASAWDEKVAKYIATGPDDFGILADVAEKTGSYWHATKPKEISDRQWKNYQKKMNVIRASYGDRPGSDAPDDLKDLF